MMGATVLVVDDEDAARTVLRIALEHSGYHVVEAQSGAEALSTVGRRRIDCVVLEVRLPDMTGLEVSDRIKGNRATRAIPILHVSGLDAPPADRSVALHRSADGYLTKPVDPDDLLATVASLVRYYEAHRTAERFAARLERLHQATLLMSAAPTLVDLCQFAATGLVSIFGVPSSVVVTRDGIGRITQAAPNDLEPTVRPCPSPRVLQLAEAALTGDVTEAPAFADLIGQAAPALASAITTPRGELIGALVLSSADEPGDEALMLDHFAQALAVALENQRLYAVEHQTALTLQRAMLPNVVPQTDELEVAVRYLAASDTVEIGGDFYEAVQLSDQVTMLAVGDVVGHSLHAATVMAELRHTLRAYATLGMGAPEILSRLGAMLRLSHPGVTATMCIAELDLRGELRVTNAGHIPPLVRAGGTARYVLGHGPLLGIASGRATPEVTVAFPPGSELLMVTDGLVERRGEDIDVGLERLRLLLESHIGEAEALCDDVLRKLTAADQLFDDVAIVAVRRRPA
jgi:CheY-like chemotaxis protein